MHGFPRICLSPQSSLIFPLFPLYKKLTSVTPEFRRYPNINTAIFRLFGSGVYLINYRALWVKFSFKDANASGVGYLTDLRSHLLRSSYIDFVQYTLDRYSRDQLKMWFGTTLLSFSLAPWVPLTAP